ncbi:MAG: flagellar biosynthetic protein FliO [Nitrospiria bacterium]
MTDPFSTLVKMISSLLFVLGIIALMAYIGRRFLSTKFRRWGAQPLIQVVSTTYLGPKREISVIEVGQERLVIGVTPQHISFITRLERTPLSPEAQRNVRELTTA